MDFGIITTKPRQLLFIFGYSIMINKLPENYPSINFAFIRGVNIKSRILRHLVVWSVFALGFYFNNENNLYVETFLNYYKISFCAFVLLMCYLNMYVMVPKFLFGGKPKMYRLCFLGLIFIASIAVLISQMIFKSIDQSQYVKTIFIPPIIQNVFHATIFLAFSTAIKLFQQSMRDTERINELTRAGLESELEQLKNQINPHFLFNMLNNVNVLTKKDPAKASQVVMKLCDLLRYQLYDSTREKVLLTADIHFLNDSLDLEKIRRDNFEYTTIKSGQINGIQVPPLLFITFVENAIKHSLSAEKASFVDIYFDIEDDRLHFTCINSKPAKKSSNLIGGIGLKNVKRRLELLFPEKHELKIHDEANLYTVKLTIQL